MLRRKTLRAFVRNHQPHAANRPASRELLIEFRGRLPGSLLAVWKKHGLGRYGSWDIELLDPREWQSSLDGWEESSSDTARPIPVALTPFGKMIAYLRPSPGVEEIYVIDPFEGTVELVASSMEKFFTVVLADRSVLDELIPTDMLIDALHELGTLAAGQVYQVDQMLLSMQMLKWDKVGGHGLFATLHEEPDPAHAPDLPGTVEDMIPAEYRQAFIDPATGDDSVTGLYLSSFLEDHRLLSLAEDGTYRLLFWHDNPKASYDRTRAYAGDYVCTVDEHGDQHLDVAIELRDDSLGSDANDDRLTVMRSEGNAFLMRTEDLGDMATSIRGQGVMEQSRYYFRKVQRSEAFEQEPYDGRTAPPLADMPFALRMLVDVDPFQMTITHVDEPNLDDEEDGEGTIMCTLDRGADDGLRMNMPIYSGKVSGKVLQGWVWEMSPTACRAGIEYQRGTNGLIEESPSVGDVLTDRQP